MERVDEGVVMSDDMNAAMGAEGVEEVVCDGGHDAG